MPVLCFLSERQKYLEMDKNADLKVFISSKNSTCDECGEDLGLHAWITLNEEKGAWCLSCSDLDYLVFLPSGDAALTRRSKKYSNLTAVVLKWSRSRKRYERQGLLVDAAALDRAEQECLADSEVRARRNQRAAERRVELDKAYVARFAEKIRELYPGIPAQREKKIAEHACLKYSNRIGRTGAAKELDEPAIRLAVIAHVRHTRTNYDELLGTGYGRKEARHMIHNKVAELLAKWEG